MCGILGWIGQQSTKDTQHFDAAVDLLTHRGPDDRGVWIGKDIILGHRRLSIIDLSVSGHQPMIDPDTGAVLIFNGEIYNHIELRKTLEAMGHKFRSHCDSEVLLRALIEWKEQALVRLNGMWAFAFWQPDRRRLLLSRDRFGVKPLYYRQGPEGLAFSSEPKALLALFPQHRSVCETTLLDFLAHNLLYARGESFYEGIKVFPPAHYAVLDDSGSLKLARYWDYPAAEDNTLKPESAAEQFDALFSDAVRIRLRADVPVGLTLSGGLDSTSVLAAASSKKDNSLICFTSTYDTEGVGELSWARAASIAAKTELIPVAAPSQHWLDTLRKLTWHMDAPGYSPAVYPLWYLMQSARSKNVPVLLEGQGADEALAGYPQYAVLELLSYFYGKSGDKRNLAGIKQRMNMLNRSFSWQRAMVWILREISPIALNWHRRRTGFQAIMRKDIALPAYPEYPRNKNDDLVRARLMADHAQNILPGLLHYGDAISMAHSIESRNPFLDYRLVEWMFKMPVNLRFYHGETKWILRDYLRGHGQAAIGNRPDKQGYPTPVKKWLASEHGHQI